MSCILAAQSRTVAVLLFNTKRASHILPYVVVCDKVCGGCPMQDVFGPGLRLASHMFAHPYGAVRLPIGNCSLRSSLMSLR
jgi:hypothetical protein